MNKDDFSPEERKEQEEYENLRQSHRMPLACPACGSLFYNWDKSFYYRHGVCADCTIEYIEGRNLDEDLLRNREELAKYIKQKISEKNKKEIIKE